MKKEREEKWLALSNEEKNEIIERQRVEEKQKDKERQAKYYQENKERLVAERKEYFQNNKEKIRQKTKEREQTTEHKEKKKMYRQKPEVKQKREDYYNEYREINIEAIRVKQNEKTTCECGSVHRKYDWKTHQQTKRHQQFIESKNQK